jgi:hypothetical protein
MCSLDHDGTAIEVTEFRHAAASVRRMAMPHRNVVSRMEAKKVSVGKCQRTRFRAYAHVLT